MSYRLRRAFLPRFRPHEAGRRGFSLLELLHVLTVLAILSVLGMVGYERRVRHVRTVEAVESVGAMGRDAATYYNQSDANAGEKRTADKVRGWRHFPPSSRASVPAELSSIRATAYQSVPEDWQASPWRELKFAIERPQFYAYSFESQGEGGAARAVAKARGDLNGDGRLSTFSLAVSASDNFIATVSARVDEQDADE